MYDDREEDWLSLPSIDVTLLSPPSPARIGAGVHPPSVGACAPPSASP